MWVESKALWMGGNGGGGVEDLARNEEMLLSPFSGLSIALSLLIRKLMQLSVLILESSFYSFFFSPLQPFSIPFSTNLCSGSR